MTWVHLDDKFFEHPKVIEAGRDARDFYLAALCYSRANGTDGFVARGAMRLIAARADIDHADAAVARLVAVKMFHVAEGGWAIHNFLKRNPSQEQMEATSKARAEAGSRGGKQKARNLLASGQANGKQNLGKPPSDKELDQEREQDGEKNGPNGRHAAGASADSDAPKPKDQPKVTRRVRDDGRVYALVDAYAVGRKQRPGPSGDIPTRERTKLYDMFEPFVPDVTKDDVIGFMLALRTNPHYRQPGAMNPYVVTGGLREWIDAGRPQSVDSRASPNGRASPSGKVYSSEEAKALVAELRAKEARAS